MMETRRCPALAVITDLRRWITASMRTAAEQADCARGTRLTEGRRLLDSFLCVNAQTFVREAQLKTAARRYTNVRESLSEAEHEWHERMAAMKAKHASRFAELHRQHQSQISEFESRWADPEFVAHLYRPSPRLLLLRARERKLATFQDFVTAKRIRQDADQIENGEVCEARRRAIAIMRCQYENLEARQHRELDCMTDRVQRSMEVCEKQRDVCVRPMQRIAKRLAELAKPDHSTSARVLPPPKVARHLREA
jgi:hypothetical protein